MTIEEMKQKKREKGYTYAIMSELSGIPLGTIQKIFNGETANPRYDTIQALEAIFKEPAFTAPLKVKEASPYMAGKAQGEYTVEDYRALPEERRVELIDGYFYDMASPTTFHQLIAGEVYRQIANYVFERNGSCTPFISPVDVQLDNDEKTMIQPDVIIVCKKEQIITSNVVGAPDFVLEVLSPSTRRKDSLLKLRKYEDAGVREYWMVDPYQKIIMTYCFECEVTPSIYPLDADVPVYIYGEELVIHFKRIAEWVKEALEEKE